MLLKLSSTLLLTLCHHCSIFPYQVISFFHYATLDRLAKIKVTFSRARFREKMDILGEKHDQTVSEVYQVVKEKEAQVA